MSTSDVALSIPITSLSVSDLVRVIEKTVGQRFDDIDARFNQIEAHFAQIDERFDQNEIIQNEILNTIDNEFLSVAQTVTNHEIRLKQFENKGPHSLWDYHDTKH